MNKKYWFMATITDGPYNDKPIYEQHAIDQHPFEKVHYWNNMPGQEHQECIILSFHEITEEEFNLFKKLENE